MPTVRALQLAADIERNGLRPVYCLVGGDDPLLSAAISLLKGPVERPELPGSITTDREETPEPAELFDELRTPPFMGLKGLRLVIVRKGEQFIAGNREALARYLEAPSPTAVLALCCGKLDRRTGVAKALERAGAVVDCSRLKWAEARQWIGEQARGRGKTLTAQASSALLEAVGPNIAMLQGELEKLDLYVGEGSAITQPDVEELVPASRTRSMFDLSEAITTGRTPEALRLTEQMLLRGHRPEEIVAFLGGQMHRLGQVKQMLAEGATRRDIEQAFKMPDFAVKKSAALAHRLSEGALARRVRVLADADEQMKTTSLLAREQPTWVSALVVRLCL